MARQQHGFEFEAKIASSLPGFKLAKPGQLFDGFLANGIPVSIKTRAAGKQVCLGDYRRQASIKLNFVMIVGTYSMGPAGRTYHKIDAHYVTAERWRELLRYDETAAMFEELKLITNEHVDDARWTEFRKKHGAAFDAQRPAVGPKIKLAMKRDSKTQKRIQCQMSNSAYLVFKLTFAVFKLDMNPKPAPAKQPVKFTKKELEDMASFLEELEVF